MSAVQRLIAIAGFALIVAACSNGDAVSDSTIDSETADAGATDDDGEPLGDIGADDWPTFRLESQRRGLDATDGPLLDEPELIWQFDTGGIVESSPAVVDNTVYVGTFDEQLWALDARTGEPRWSFAVGGLLRSSPAVVDGVVFFGADDNLFYAIDSTSGEEIWRFELGGGGQQSSPAVVDGVVFFGAFDNFVYALDAATGAEIWRFETGDGILSSPFVRDGVVYIGSIDGVFYAIDAATGAEVWNHETVRPIFSSGAFVPADVGPNGRTAIAFGADDGRVYNIDLETGELNWLVASAAPVFATPAVDDGIVYVGSRDGSFAAIEADTSEVVWATDLTEVLGSAAIDDERIYVGSSDGNLYVLDRADGSTIAQLPTGEMVWTSPALVDGFLYFGAHDGQIHAYRVQ